MQMISKLVYQIKYPPFSLTFKELYISYHVSSTSSRYLSFYDQEDFISLVSAQFWVFLSPLEQIRLALTLRNIV